MKGRGGGYNCYANLKKDLLKLRLEMILFTSTG
jgi:hypothetical protein